MGMFSQIKASVNSILPSLYGDKELACDVTWKRFKTSTFNAQLGYNEDTYDSFTIKAIKIEKTQRPVVGGRRSGGVPMTTGDVSYLFQGPDVPANATTRDLLIDGTFTYQIESIYPVFGLVTRVEVKGYA